jgi:formamidopyrimidine-DNA glycosylase (fpg)
MPELPEVETIRRGLSRLIIGKAIRNITPLNEKSFPNALISINQFSLGSTIVSVRRRAKVLIIDLDTQYSFVIHLKMTGQLVYRGLEDFAAGHPTDSFQAPLPDRSTRVIFEFTDDSHLYFNDQRKFGWIKFMPTVEIANMPFMQKVGPEPLEKDFTSQQFKSRFVRKQRSKIKSALLDQSVIAGVGNIYADESLFFARIHPERLVESLTDEDFENLYEGVRSTMQASIDSGGSTMKTYVNADGTKGSYLDKFAQVFRREGQSCPVCGSEIQKIRVAGRGTHICPNCQKR